MQIHQTSATPVQHRMNDGWPIRSAASIIHGAIEALVGELAIARTRMPHAQPHRWLLGSDVHRATRHTLTAFNTSLHFF
jgi:hypothetical protein